jgi:hypothetical protein
MWKKSPGHHPPVVHLMNGTKERTIVGILLGALIATVHSWRNWSLENLKSKGLDDLTIFRAKQYSILITFWQYRWYTNPSFSSFYFSSWWHPFYKIKQTPIDVSHLSMAILADYYKYKIKSTILNSNSILGDILIGLTSYISFHITYNVKKLILFI